jgi:flavin reductase (DIM6/NTAB) family NADH-FMN oxidoreductase RutF
MRLAHDTLKASASATPGAGNVTESADAIAVAQTDFRQVLGRFCTGLTVLSSLGESGKPVGFTCQSFASLSLDPPLVVFCPSQASTTWPAIRESGRFCASILAGDQQDIAQSFAVSGGDKFASVVWSGGFGGLPVIEGALAWVAGTIESESVAGDHSIVVGRVHELALLRDAEPLLFYRGGFGQYLCA